MCALFRGGQPGRPGACLPSQPKEACPCVIKREGKQQGVLFRCCSPKWGPRGGDGAARKLAKLMVIGGLTECVGPGGRERGRAGHLPSGQSGSDEIGKREALSAEVPKLLATRLDSTDALGTGHLHCGVSPPWTAQPQDSVSRPSFVQLTQAGPSLSPADSHAGSQEVTGHGRAPRPGAHKAGAEASSPGNTQCLGTGPLSLAGKCLREYGAESNRELEVNVLVFRGVNSVTRRKTS